MDMTKNFCGVRFAFDIPDNHPWFSMDIDDIWKSAETNKTDLPPACDFVETDSSGAKLAVVFFTPERAKLEDTINRTQKWLEKIKG